MWGDSRDYLSRGPLEKLRMIHANLSMSKCDVAERLDSFARDPQCCLSREQIQGDAAHLARLKRDPFFDGNDPIEGDN